MKARGGFQAGKSPPWSKPSSHKQAKKESHSSSVQRHAGVSHNGSPTLFYVGACREMLLHRIHEQPGFLLRLTSKSRKKSPLLSQGLAPNR